jgi:hypothetical protein
MGGGGDISPARIGPTVLVAYFFPAYPGPGPRVCLKSFNHLETIKRGKIVLA